MFLAKCYQGDIIQEDETKEADNTQGNMAFYSKSLKEREHLGDLGVETIKVNC
jgi:hypothetical protein